MGSTPGAIALLAAVMHAASTTHAQQSPHFQRESVAVGGAPVSVALGDVNGDGHIDIVTAHDTANHVSVLFGTDGGSLRTRTTIGVASAPRSVAIGDLNGDGFADLVTANFESGSLSLLAGTGEGRFREFGTLAVGAGPCGVVVADMNGDGLADLLSADYGAGSISLRLGTGAGAFGALRSFTVGEGPRSVACGDLDGDGIPDVVTANALSRDLSMLRGTGNGFFEEQTILRVGSAPVSVAVGDLDGDGHQDVLTANVSSADVTLLRGTVSGSFGAPVMIAVGHEPSSLAMRDMDGDGCSDLVATSHDEGTVSMLFAGNSEAAGLAGASGGARHASPSGLPGATSGPVSMSPTKQAGTGGDSLTFGTETIDVVRDYRGVPQIFASTLAGAMYGLGYATARDRLFQMDFSRRYMQGRLAEWLGAGTGNANLNLDKRIRTIGYARHAVKLVSMEALPDDILPLLQAYADGVNAYVATPGFAMPPAYASLGITGAFDSWKPAHCLIAWDRLSYIFNSLSIDEEASQFALCNSPAGCTHANKDQIDNGAAVVPAPSGVEQPPTGDFPENPSPAFSASHSWVVAPSRSTTGFAMLQSDPQTLVRAPSVWMEAGLHVPGLNVRGIGVAGAPGFIAFFNDRIAQGISALGGDLTDLFALKLVGQSYEVDGVLHPFESVFETIKIKNATAISLEVKSTSWGPVINGLLAQPSSTQFAMKHTELMQTQSHSIVGALRMMQATDLDSYRTALLDWMLLGLNAIYADAAGNIAYHPLFGVPKRAPSATHPGFEGRVPYDGSVSANDWGPVLDADERPHVINPPDGYLFTANHLVVGTWYTTYTGYGGIGDTMRSMRLRYLFAEKLRQNGHPWEDMIPGAMLSPDDMLAFHQDIRNDATRVFVDSLYRLVDAGLISMGSPTTGKAWNTWNALRLWSGVFDQNDPYTDIARSYTDIAVARFRPLFVPELTDLFGGGEPGICNWTKRIDKGELSGTTDLASQAYLIDVAVRAWDALPPGTNPDPLAWTPNNPPFVVKYQTNFYCPTGVGSCSFAPANDFSVSLIDHYTHTILSQTGNSYSQFVRFDDVNASRAMLPPGVSELPTSPFFNNSLETWVNGALDPAPLDPALVMAGSLDSVMLQYIH